VLFQLPMTVFHPVIDSNDPLGIKLVAANAVKGIRIIKKENAAIVSFFMRRNFSRAQVFVHLSLPAQYMVWYVKNSWIYIPAKEIAA